MTPTQKIQTQILHKKTIAKLDTTSLQKHWKPSNKLNASNMVKKFFSKPFQLTWKNNNQKGLHFKQWKLTTSDQYWKKFLMVKNKFPQRSYNQSRFRKNQDFTFFENRTWLSSIFKTNQSSNSDWFIYWYLIFFIAQLFVPYKLIKKKKNIRKEFNLNL